MAKRDEAFEAFRAANPVDESSVQGPNSPGAEALLTLIAATAQDQLPRGRAFTRRRLVTAIAVAVLALALAAAAWLTFRDVSDPTSVICYREASLVGDASDAPIEGELGVSLCEGAWREGTLVNEDIVPAGQVPPLVGCALESGNLAVFPSDDDSLCARLGLAQPNPESVSEAQRIRRLTSALVDHFSRQDCQSVEAAEQDVRTILDSQGFGDWQVTVMPGHPRDQCASFGIEPADETVLIIRIPDLG